MEEQIRLTVENNIGIEYSWNDDIMIFKKREYNHDHWTDPNSPNLNNNIISYSKIPSLYYFFKNRVGVGSLFFMGTALCWVNAQDSRFLSWNIVEHLNFYFYFKIFLISCDCSYGFYYVYVTYVRRRNISPS